MHRIYMFMAIHTFYFKKEIKNDFKINKNKTIVQFERMQFVCRAKECVSLALFSISNKTCEERTKKKFD